MSAIRVLLGAAAVFVALSIMAPAVVASAPSPLPFQLKLVGAGVYAAIDGPDDQSGSNAGFVVGDDGVVVVDAFFNPDAARALLTEIRKVTTKPVRYVVNTHYHVDHVGGDAVFREAGAVIIAHRSVHGWVRTENLHLLGGDAISPKSRALVEGLALPDIGVDGNLTLWLGGRRIEVRTVRGHTGGDLVVAVPDAKVLFCGDMVWRRTSPNIIDGNVAEWIAAVAAFAAAPDAGDTRFVPGHGDVANAADVADFGAYLQLLTVSTEGARKAGLHDAALVADVLPKMKARYGGWAAFDYFAPKEIGFMNAELAGTKRVPVPVP
jgi:cyclase